MTIASDHPDVLLLSQEFSEVVAEWATAEELAEIRRLNATVPYCLPDGPCATHDFFDANEAMVEAFGGAFSREPDLMDREDGSEAPDVALWNAAWARAKKYALTQINPLEATAS